jgi:hypothetical protein
LNLDLAASASKDKKEEAVSIDACVRKSLLFIVLES